LLAWLTHFIERHRRLHRLSLAVWRHFPPRLAGFLKGLLATSWTVGAVAVLLDENATPPEVLLVEHSYRTKGVWGLPGGALESNLASPLAPRNEDSTENLLESTLRREVFEELGIEIEVLRMLRLDAVPYVPEEPGPYRLDFFYLCAPRGGFSRLREAIKAGEVAPRSPEIKRIRLVPVDRLPEYDLFSSDARLLSREIHYPDPQAPVEARVGA
jgi:8-oxo-dGTP pyrophosphatase MutT (NUDIX family)